MQNDRLAVLQEIIKIFGAGLELKPLLNAVASAVARLTGADSCLIYVFDPESQELVLYGASSPHPRHIGRIKMKLGEGITGWVAEQRQVVKIAQKAYQDERFKLFHTLPEDRYEAFFSAPLVADGEVVGVMNIQHVQPHTHSPEEVELLEALANMVAGAIANARVFEQVRHQARHLQALFQLAHAVNAHQGIIDETLTFIGQMLEETLGLPSCRVLIYEPAKRRFRGPHGTRVQESHPLFKQLVRARAPFTFGKKTVWAVPVRFGGRWVGAIIVHPADTLDDNTLSILADLSSHVGAFLQNLILESELRRAREALETRKVLERAKLLLMERYGMREQEAHRWLQRTAMERRMSLRQVCEAVLLTEDLSEKKGDAKNVT